MKAAILVTVALVQTAIIFADDASVVDLAHGQRVRNVQFRVVNEEAALGESPFLTAGPLPGFGRLWKSSVAHVRTVVADFNDKVLPMIGYPERPDNVWSDQDYHDFFKSKIALWSNYTYKIEDNGEVGIKRYQLGSGYKKSGSAAQIRAKLFSLAQSDGTGFQLLESRQYYGAAVCFAGEGNGAFIQLANGSLPSYFHEFGHTLDWDHNSLFHRLSDGRWGQMAIYGDLLSSAGGMQLPRGIDHYGPEGYIPMQKHAFGWFDEDSYIKLVPNKIYRLRTVHEGSIETSSYPMSLTWYDTVYDAPAWFSFYKYPLVFGSAHEKTHGDNAHGGGMGFAMHLVRRSDNNGALQIKTFGKKFVHHNGLIFETIDFNEDYVDVRVTYERAQQTTWIPQFDIGASRTRMGSSRRRAVTTVVAVLKRNYDEKEIDPFSITRTASVVCAWGTYRTTASDFAFIGPGYKFAGSVLQGKRPVRSQRETLAVRVRVGFKRVGRLRPAERQATYPCILKVGRFLWQDITLTFV